MKDYKNLVIRISKLIAEIGEIVEEEGYDDDFSYVFCFGIGKDETKAGKIEYTAGYSWHVEDRDQFNEMMVILTEAYDLDNLDLGGLLDGICLN